MESTDEEEDDLRIMVNLMDDSVGSRDAAMAELLRKYGGIIKGMVRKEFGTQLAKGEERDVLIRTVTRAWKYAGSYDDSKSKLSTWLVSIALNEAKDLISENTPDFALVDEEYLGVQLSEDGLEDEPTKEEKKIVRDFKVVLSRLPKLQKAIIEADLACGEAADGKRLAKLHGTTVGSIYVSRKKAHDKIEHEMKKLGHFEPQHIPG